MNRSDAYCSSAWLGKEMVLRQYKNIGESIYFTMAHMSQSLKKNETFVFGICITLTETY